MNVPWEPPAGEIRLVDVLDALADPVRLALVARLASLGSEKCTDINADVNVHKSTMSHHYRVLREAGVTRTVVHGRQRWVRLRHAELDARFPGLLDSVLSAATHPVQPTARHG
ncbi:DNA-binding transcriptional ArsR family regulator [Haloactinopolyspora alba]|uniref:DNA-binding transcriptional ArsR family regulator n=1 Tax=Haloactinopolyspora alba TaxID=648780 RepID=A0A2P8DFU4_9ACTN|nr:helix-turn-helix domain-containing protein [Haloactinopolyspora alba]PSK96081.1 DNA-binding transcriptional ArsR family regulator [Haloactinopolyspora alba]